MTLAPNEDFWRRLFKFNFWALSDCFITEKSKKKFLLRTYFSYLVQITLFYCLNNSRSPLLSNNIVPVHSKLLTRKRGLDRKFYAQELVTQTDVRTSRNSANRAPSAPCSLSHEVTAYFLAQDGEVHAITSSIAWSNIDSGRAKSIAECRQAVCESALSCSADTLLHRQHN